MIWERCVTTLTQPVYIETYKKGLLKKKADAAWGRLESCMLCPRKCGANRQSGQTGKCKTGLQAVVSSYNPHFGEEAPLVGAHGSGTIFFTHCSLLCKFCQNFDISHHGYGEEVTHENLAHMMLQLQNMGCHNINFVTPTHVVPHILKALEFAVAEGLTVPLVYNTSAYDNIETLKLLDGIFDIYMPDFKFWDPRIAKMVCDAEDYPDVAQHALMEMHRQVGDLSIDESGLANRGLLIRHLVLPSGFSGTKEVMRFIALHVSPDSYVNIMAQYRPCGRASEIDALSNCLSPADYEKAVQTAKNEGINRLDVPRRVFMIR